MKELLLVFLIAFVCGEESGKNWVAICKLPPETGHCRAAFPNYFYNAASKKCEIFTYGGCGGNKNNFDSEDECRQRCVSSPKVIAADEDNDEAQDGDTNEWRKLFRSGDVTRRDSRRLFGNLFQKSFLKTFDFFDLFKPDPTDPTDEQDENDKKEKEVRKEKDEDEDDDEDDDDEEEEKDDDNSDDGDDRLKTRFPNMFNLLGSKLKPNFNPFSKSMTGGLFGDLFGRNWYKSVNSFQTRLDKSFERISKKLNERTTPNIFGSTTISRIFEGSRAIPSAFGGFRNDTPIGCLFCEGVVKIVTWEIKFANMSIAAVLASIEKVCALFPISKAQCDLAIKDIKVIINFIEQGLLPGDICKRIGLCPNSTLPKGVTETVTVSFTRRCSPLCNFMKSVHEEKLSRVIQSWNATGAKLKSFCDDNKILRKCNVFYKMVDKAMAHLSYLTAKKTDEDCKCFKRQPLFDTKDFDSCLRCKQFEKGMWNELQQANRSVTLLTSRIHDLCRHFPTAKCATIVKEFKLSLKGNLGNLVLQSDICNVTGYCGNTRRPTDLIGSIGKSVRKLTGMLLDPIPMSIDGLGLNWKRFSHSCLFCKKCMVDLQETFKIINETQLDLKKIYPSVKEGFSIYCNTKTVGKISTMVCKKIVDGIESIHKAITKQDGGEGMCKVIGLC